MSEIININGSKRQQDQQFLPVLVEFYLNEPTSKTKSKQIMFTLLTYLNINDEYDINSISYLTETLTNLVQKVLIQFKYTNAAEKFYEYINSQEISSKYKFSNIIKTTLDLNDDFLFENSTKHSLSDSIFIFPDDSDTKNQLFKVDTSLENNLNDLNDSLISYANSILSKNKSGRSSEDSMPPLNSFNQEFSLNNVNIKSDNNQLPTKTHRSISISSDIEHLSFNHNEDEDLDDTINQVDLCSLKPIQKQDLEAILLFFENPKRSGGCEIVSYELIQNNHLIKVKYEKYLAKQRVLKQCVHQFKNYKFIANDSAYALNTFNKEQNKQIDKRTIILKNIQENVKADVIRLYAEYLVMNDNELNDVEEIECSKLFENTYYIKFKLDYDYDQLVRRVNKKKLYNQSLELMQAFNTNMILIKLNKNLKNKLNSLDYDFNEYPFKSINDTLVLTHGNKDIISNLIGGQNDYDDDFSIEFLYNYDLLSESELLNENNLSATINEQSELSGNHNKSASSILNITNELIKLKVPFNYAKDKLNYFQDKIAHWYKSSPLEEFFISNKKCFISFFMVLLVIINAQIFYGIMSFSFNNKNSNTAHDSYSIRNKESLFSYESFPFSTKYQSSFWTSSLKTNSNKICNIKFFNDKNKSAIYKSNFVNSTVSLIQNSIHLESNKTHMNKIKTDKKEKTNLISSQQSKNKPKQKSNKYNKKKKSVLKYTFNRFKSNGHKDIITSLAVWSKNGLIATGSYDKTIKIWDVNKGILKYAFDETNGGHNGPVWSMVSLKDGYLASGSLDFTIKIWNINKGSLKYTFDKKNGGHSKAISSLVALPNHSMIASGSWDSKIKIWDIKNGNLNFTLEDNSSASYISTGTTSVKSKSPISHLALLSNNYLASGYDDSVIKIWDLNTRKMKYIFKKENGGHFKSISALVSLSNGLLASSSYDNTIKIWNTNIGKLKYSFDENTRGHQAHVTSLIPINNECLASGSDDNTIKIWNVSSGILKYTINEEYDDGHSKPVTALTVLPSKNYLISGSEDSTIKVWDISSLIKNNKMQDDFNDVDLKQTFDFNSNGHNWTISNLISYSNNYLASGSWDACVKIWEIN